MNGQGAKSDTAPPPIHIPGYRIKGILGRGGMATVYLAVQESLGREVALKVLDPAQAQGEHFSRRFLREARIVSQLMHPNIVTVFDVGLHQGYHYLSMEYIAGRDLKQAGPELDRKELLRIIKDVARALDFAATKGYVHRDVKPENIMIRDSDGRVVLMDFGIARSYQANHALTRAGSALGTPYYMSPEQNKGQHADHRSDIYSLGVVFFHMLAGYVPYDADSAVAIGIKHITAPIPTLSDELQIFQPIINACLAKEADDRYQSAAELIEALDAITGEQLAEIDEKVAAFRDAGNNHDARTLITSGTSPQATAKPARKNAFTGFLVLLVLTLGGVFAWQQRQTIVAHASGLNIPALNGIIAELRPLLHLPEKQRPAPATAKPAPAAPPIPEKTDHDPQTQALTAIEAIQQAIESGDRKLALALMDKMQQDYPELAGREKFRHTRERLQREQAADEHVNAAKEYIEAGRLIEAQGSDALSELDAALTRQPDHPAARRLLEDLNRDWLQKAQTQTPTWRLRKQLQRLEAVSSKLSVTNPRLEEQRKQLSSAIRRIAQVKNLLQQADTAFDAGRFITPPEHNARQLYQKVLQQAPGNRRAKKRLEEIRKQLGERVRRAIEEDRLTRAGVFLEQMQAVYGNSDWLLQLEAELEQAIEARRPRIEQLVFSAMPLLSLDQPQPETLQPGRTLYIGFHFRNMENAPTLLQAVLLDGAGRVQIAQKPVIVSASEGDHFFQIDLPVEGFSEGSYILEMRLENRRLLSQPFVIGNIHQP